MGIRILLSTLLFLVVFAVSFFTVVLLPSYLDIRGIPFIKSIIGGGILLIITGILYLTKYSNQFTHITFDKKSLSFLIKGSLVAIVLSIIVKLTIGFLGFIEFPKLMFDDQNMSLRLVKVLLSSIGQEVFFCGVLLNILLLKTPKYIALIIVSILYSLFHFNPSQDIWHYVGIFFYGTLLWSHYIHYKNIWFSIGLHIFWSLMSGYFGFQIIKNNVLMSGNGWSTIVLFYFVISSFLMYFIFKRNNTLNTD